MKSLLFQTGWYLAVKIEGYQVAISRTAPMVKLVDTADLKSAAS